MNPDQCWRKPLCGLSSCVPQWETRQFSKDQNFLNLSQKWKPKNALFCSCKINLSTLKITRTKPKDESDSEWVSKTCVSNFYKDRHGQILKTLGPKRICYEAAWKDTRPGVKMVKILSSWVSKLHPVSKRSSLHYRKRIININSLSDDFSRS